ncbi:uncharacterized protein CMU_006540 [Cryptosporidium muris RN66]|uniref:Autophagy-related protein 16 domain-containing protein n=1 Tax=Cryptosporidium muris (strain RN66) TaxID=441375 RepID=B6AHN6_CRYMR|nr:uncharacterized protein CMU_006540 [Cryptosporidium muris RN66]EEA07731.1 hypothetical protein CMU_006540 [Cryptosporidium muris RN66]|eukprot:XP_002142080.1 hypothetical protein [Cryptosporidium muris RN66]
MENWREEISKLIDYRNQLQRPDILALYDSYLELLNIFKSNLVDKKIYLEVNGKRNHNLHSLQVKLSELQDKLIESYKNKTESDDSIESLRIKIKKLTELVNEKESKIQNMHKTIYQLQQQIESLNKQNNYTDKIPKK